MRTGKNVFADYLCQHYSFKQVAFADKLKQISIEMFDLTESECYGDKSPRSRDILQKVGVAMRGIEEDVWCRYVLKNVKEGQPTAISDVRFPNEAQIIKDYGGRIVRINRTTNEQYGTSHISETALDDYSGFDFVIDNNGKLGELHEKIEELMMFLNCPKVR